MSRYAAKTIVFLSPLILLFLLSPPAARAQPSRPNIVLILADDVGREVLGCYGGESYETPQLDALARDTCRSADKSAWDDRRACCSND